MARATHESAECETTRPRPPDLSDDPCEPRNFLLLALIQVLQRIGWIFKTESIVMPAFLDFIGGGPVLRGFLPVMNRLGLAIPPLLFARRLKVMPYKKWAAAFCLLAMAAPFAVLALASRGAAGHATAGVPNRQLAVLFLVLYGVFFSLAGLNQLAVSTLHGKLIRPERRGRLLAASTMVGAPLAIVFAWLLMPGWLARADGGFGSIFLMPVVMFVLAGLVSLWVAENPDSFQEPGATLVRHLQSAWLILTLDVEFRRLAIVAALFGGAFMMFPHYQALGRERLGLDLSNLMLWVCVQNLATAAASMLVGPLADRLGNRAALNVAILAAATAPLLALALGRVEPALGRSLFWLVFLAVGVTPICVSLLVNYTLEMAAREDHPRYVSTVGMCLAAPVVVGAPLIGCVIKYVGFDAVFLVGTLLVVAAGLLTFRLMEPRHRA